MKLPEGAIGKIVDPDTDEHLGWIVSPERVQIGWAVKADDGAILVLPYDGPLPEGADLVVVLKVVK
ncbi:MAG TPA: hypothetical protein VMW94_09725 [Actinomycetes bacterium]|nr:hypothetical protein [Actinomycetes bacterium]